MMRIIAIILAASIVLSTYSIANAAPQLRPTNNGPSFNPATNPQCNGAVTQVYQPTPACGYNDAGAANPGLYEQFPQWNGASCVMTLKFISCSGEP